MKPRRFEFVLSGQCLLMAVFILFIVPVPALYACKRSACLFYRGVYELMGEHGLRYFGALPFVLLGWCSWPRAGKLPRSSSNRDDENRA